ncbi:Uncharacterised protein [Mycobacteroides abscessus subsp. abscessus]|nr:Uncharacterised protein [Mycobacteroides abscessus subsp. abscessus]
MTASNSSSDMLKSIRSRVMPALLTTTCRPPRDSAVEISSSAVARSPISPATVTPLDPAAAISSSTSLLSNAGAMSLTTTVAPDRAKPIASARPSPAAAPVTMATRPLRSASAIALIQISLQSHAFDALPHAGAARAGR